MRKLILLAHTSLDGFVAGQTGELTDFDASEENLKFVCQLTKEADAALFGRISYQLLESFWPAAGDRPKATAGEIAYSNWYNKAQKIVFSNTMPETNSKKATIIRGDMAATIAAIKQQPGKDILIFGSPAVSQQLMELNLIDSYWVFVNPIIFGKGIPLFKEMKRKIKLKLVDTQQFFNGEFGLHYIVNKE